MKNNQLCSLSFFLLITLGVSVISCGAKKGKDESTYESKVTTENGEDIYNISTDDDEMNQAINKAQATLGDFEKALKSKNPNFEYFTLKVKFNGEHMWVSKNWMKGDIYYGILDSEPMYEENKKMQLGDTIKIITADITDWQYMTGDTVIGGYTTRVLRNKMSNSERDEFDQMTGNIYQ